MAEIENKAVWIGVIGYTVYSKGAEIFWTKVSGISLLFVILFQICQLPKY